MEVYFNALEELRLTDDFVAARSDVITDAIRENTAKIALSSAILLGSVGILLPSASASGEQVKKIDATTYQVTLPAGGNLSGAQAKFPDAKPSLATLADAFDTNNPNKVQPGTVTVKTAESGPTFPDGYVLKNGDTLSRIARRSNVSVEDLSIRYGIKDPNIIIAGRSLKPVAPTLAPAEVKPPTPKAPVPPATSVAPVSPAAPIAPAPAEKVLPPVQPIAQSAAVIEPKPAPAKVEAAPVLASTNLNLVNIQPLYGAEASRIQDIVKYLVDKHGFSPKGAAYMAASGLRESWLKTDVTGDHGAAKGLFGMTNERAVDMPADFYGQIDFAVQDMNADKLAVKHLVLQALRDPNASEGDVKLAIRWFERYDQNDVNHDGHADGEGQRFIWGAQIYEWIMAKTPVAPEAVPAPAAKAEPQATAPALTPTPTVPAAAPTPPPVTTPPTTALPPTTTAAPQPATPAPVAESNLVKPAPKQEAISIQKNEVAIQQLVSKEQALEILKKSFHGKYIDINSIEQEENGITTVLVNGEKININIAQQLADMLEAAQADGIELKVLDGFRTKADQSALRKVNGCPDIWYAKAELCRVPTAIPGTSNHEGGEAVDLRQIIDGNEIEIKDHSNHAFKWLAKNASKFGVYNLPSEPWHWSKDGK